MENQLEGFKGRTEQAKESTSLKSGRRKLVNLKKRKKKRWKPTKHRGVGENSLSLMKGTDRNTLEAELKPSRLNSAQKQDTHYNQTIGRQRLNYL